MNLIINGLVYIILTITLYILISTIDTAEGQNIKYKLVDVGVLNHSRQGKGIEMKIKPSQMPPGGSFFGSYVLKFYHIDNGTCGNEL